MEIRDHGTMEIRDHDPRISVVADRRCGRNTLALAALKTWADLSAALDERHFTLIAWRALCERGGNSSCPRVGCAALQGRFARQGPGLVGQRQRCSQMLLLHPQGARLAVGRGGLDRGQLVLASAAAWLQGPPGHWASLQRGELRAHFSGAR